MKSSIVKCLAYIFSITITFMVIHIHFNNTNQHIINNYYINHVEKLQIIENINTNEK